MNKKRIVVIIGSVLVFFVLLNVVAKSFCDPSKEGGTTSFIEKNIPKPSGFDVSGLRLTWALWFSKFCGNDAPNQRF